jgi:hypothetical protein
VSLPPLHLRRTWPFWLVVALVVAVGTNNVVQALTDWHLRDMEVYREAARRILAGEPLYGGDVTTLNAYRYAPWFAYAWIPLALLPDAAVSAGWSIVLLAVSAASIWRIMGVSRERLVLVLLFGPMLFGISAIGNTQPLIVGALLFALPTRWAWVAIGATASLKVVPLAFVAVLIGERRWGQAVAACILAAALWAPILLFPVEPITWDPGPLRTFPVPAWLAIAGVSAVVALWLATRGSAYTSVAAAAAAVLGLPRLFVYEVLLMMPAVPPTAEAQRQPSPYRADPNGSATSVSVGSLEKASDVK